MTRPWIVAAALIVASVAGLAMFASESVIPVPRGATGPTVVPAAR